MEPSVTTTPAPDPAPTTDAPSAVDAAGLGAARHVLIPACISKTLTIERNRVRQVLVPEQRVDLGVSESNASALTFSLFDDETAQIVRRKSQTLDSHRGLLVPTSVQLQEEGDLRETPGTRWIGDLAASAPAAVLASLKDAFAFQEDRPDEGIRGLRSPQIGALHAVLGYWTTDPKEPATIVMPTGTGKTETMLALFAQQCIERLLVVVPSDALRIQVAGKFE